MRVPAALKRTLPWIIVVQYGIVNPVDATAEMLSIFLGRFFPIKHISLATAFLVHSQARHIPDVVLYPPEALCEVIFDKHDKNLLWHFYHRRF